LPAGQEVRLLALTLEAAREITSRVLNQNKLEIPKGVDFGQRRLRYWNAMDSEERPVSAGTSILENAIDELRLRELPDEYVYYAVTSSCPDFVPHGAKLSAEEDGFHVLKGTWKH
jgi:hypothetical protein